MISERREQESSEFGLNNSDLYHQAFGPENHEIVNAFYEVWFPVRKELFTLIKQRLEEPDTVPRADVREEVERFSNAVAPYNRRFLEMCLQKYTAYLKGWLRKAN